MVDELGKLMKAGLDGARLLGFLSGHWRLERTASNGTQFSGQAEFLPLPDDALLLRETGKVALANGGALNAGREWIWKALPGRTPPGIDIHYPEERGGELYHHLLFEVRDNCLSASDTHLCGQDTYFATYAIKGDELCIDHAIKGPSKELEVMARFYRY